MDKTLHHKIVNAGGDWFRLAGYGVEASVITGLQYSREDVRKVLKQTKREDVAYRNRMVRESIALLKKHDDKHLFGSYSNSVTRYTQLMPELVGGLGVSEPATYVCHGHIPGNGVVVRNVISPAKILWKGYKEAYLPFTTWVLKQSPFRHAIVEHTAPTKAVKNGGYAYVRMDKQSDSHMANTALRVARERPDVMINWHGLVKQGYNPSLAFVSAYVNRIDRAGCSESPRYFPTRIGDKLGHSQDAMNPLVMSPSNVLAFIKGAPDNGYLLSREHSGSLACASAYHACRTTWQHRADMYLGAGVMGDAPTPEQALARAKAYADYHLITIRGHL